MGSWFFSVRSDNPDPVSAFKQLAEQDRYENGNDTYNGSIGQKSSFTVLSKKPLTASAAQRLADDFSDTSDKYDAHCGAIALADRGGKAVRRKPRIRAASEDDARAQLREKYGSSLSRVVTLKPKAPPHSGKITTSKTEAQPRIVWGINGKGSYPNKTAAAKAAREKARLYAAKAKAGDDHIRRSGGEFVVAPRLESAPAAVVLRVGLFDKPVAWEVEVELQEIDESKPAGWLFVGWARS